MRSGLLIAVVLATWCPRRPPRATCARPTTLPALGTSQLAKSLEAARAHAVARLA